MSNPIETDLDLTPHMRASYRDDLRQKALLLNSMPEVPLVSYPYR